MGQGVFVFLFYIVLNDQVKTHWLVKMGLQEEKRSTTSSSAAGKSTMGTKATAVSVSASPNADNIYENAAASNEEHTYQVRSMPLTAIRRENMSSPSNQTIMRIFDFKLYLRELIFMKELTLSAKFSFCSVVFRSLDFSRC